MTENMSKAGRAISDFVKKVDMALILLCVGFSAFGVAVIFSATHNISGRYAVVQCLGIGIGVIAMILVSLIDYEVLLKLWKVYVPICVLLMVLTYVWGYAPPGTDNKAWLQLPGGLLLQPSELLKLAFIYTLSLHIQTLGDRIKAPKGVLGLIAHAAVPIGLVLLQRDWGSMIIFVFIFLFITFSAGVQLRYFAIAFGAAAVSIPLLWTYVLKTYQKKRILAVYFPELDPDYDYIYQQIMGKYSIGSGGFFGTGWLKGPRTQASLVPEQRNDFIIAALGEEFGFLGCLLVMIILFAILMRILNAARMSRDVSGKCICVGVFAIILTQTIINVGMTLALVPVIGVTLPFFSSGGTSVMVSFISIGMVLGVYNRRERYVFFNKVIR